MRVVIAPDPQKAHALRAMARTTLERLDTTDKSAYVANTITDYYDALHKLMDAIALERGVKIKGEGAHQELIEYLHQQKLLTELERVFLQELRDYRNRIAYEGFSITPEYLASSEPGIRRILKKLNTRA